jgi:hypothetical protein
MTTTVSTFAANLDRTAPKAPTMVVALAVLGPFAGNSETKFGARHHHKGSHCFAMKASTRNPTGNGCPGSSAMSVSSTFVS